MPTSRPFPRNLLPRRLAAWLALAFTLLSFLLSVLLVTVIERRNTEQVKSSIGHGLEELALQTSDKLERGMYERYREVRLISQRRGLRPETPMTRRRETLDQLQDSYGYYSWIGIAGLDGKVQVAAKGLLEGADVSKRPWFKDALNGKHAGDVHEAVLLAKLLPQQAEPWRFVDVAFLVPDEHGLPQGVLGVHLSWQWARDVERSVIAPIAARRQVEALIVDAGGKVLLGPPGAQGGTLSLASLKAAQTGTGAGYLVEKWPDGGSWLVGYARGHGHAEYPGMGWTVLVRQKADDAYAPVRRLSEYGLAAGVLLAALCSLAGVVIARRITRPLDELAHSAQRIRKGEPVTIDSGRGGYEEVEALSGTLNVLVEDLVRRRSELEDLNATLELRVEQRTVELEQALATVRASQQRIVNIIETAQDAFISVDLDGRITDWNSAAQALLGWSRQEAVGQLLFELAIAERHRPAARQALQHFRDTGLLDLLDGRVERTLVRRDGVEITAEMTVGLVGTGNGVFFSVFLHDVSQRKEVERMKNEFVSTVSHELRTPLTAISASLSLLNMGMAGELPADAKGLVDVASASSERLVRLIGDVLDIQKMEAGQMDYRREDQGMLRIVEGAVAAMDSFAAQAGVTLAFEAGEGAGKLRAEVDHDRITQVLTNLLSNAIKFSEPGSEVLTRLSDEGGKLRIAVIDHGTGIPEAFRGRIFQRFAQADSADSRKKGGTGLGLSICQTIVEEHGGRIWFETAEGEGTSFFVELPATVLP
ncbi:Sensor protein kinase WalK [Massilia sp. Bi118]|uniref:ATP-binding protein n=1 Tax=Massilia sp. Bi118 TaxID=2822346 RepID=UPI001DADC74F|nr:ATP-binding protein [Massilia sp. Bi118]CAH0316645.1 Sensor protein kinase WalK [Massilia sp. Bi118]